MTTMKSKLKNTLSGKRYNHSVNVCKEAVKLARLYGVDEEKAYTAGILHDCAKGYSIDKQIKLCEKYGITLGKNELECPSVIHAPLGAKIAEYEYGVNDNEILNAIKYHTIPSNNMSLLDKIISVADMTEPSRDFPGVEELRDISYTDIDEAFKLSLKQTLLYNIKKESIIHPKTLEVWNNLLIREKGEK